MSVFVEELIDYLVTASVFTAKGTDVFYSYFPDITADPSACLRETGGYPSPVGQPIFDATVQAIVRGSDYDTAREKAAGIYDTLHGISSVALTSSHIMFCEATPPPGDIGPDKSGRHLISMNFHFRTKPASLSGNAQQPAKGGDPNLP